MKMVLKKYLLFVIFLAGVVFGQTNGLIKDNAGNLLPTEKTFCPGDVFNLNVDDFSDDTLPMNASFPVNDFFNESTTNEKDIPFTDNKNNSIFSKKIDLGFDFKFFGKTYKSVVVGSNGRLVLSQNETFLDNLNNADLYEDRVFPNVELASRKYNQVFKNDVSREENLAQIFVGFTRLNSSTSTVYKYKPVQVGGVKGYQFSFKEVIPYNESIGSTYGGTFNGRVILLEDGRVILNVYSKLNQNYNAILGVQNEEGDEFIMPPDNPSYNNGKWLGEPTRAFVIRTGTKRTAHYQWTVDRNNDGTPDDTFFTRQIAYVPTTNVEKLSVKITFDEEPTIKEAAVLFNKLEKPVIKKENPASCGAGVKLSVTNSQAGTTYEWYEVGNPTPVSNGTEFLVVKSGNYYVQPKGCSVQKSDTEQVNISSAIPQPAFNDGKVFNICGSENEKTVNLLDLIKYSAPGFSVKILDAAGNEIADSQNVKIVAGENKFRLSVSSADDCNIDIKFTVNYSVLSNNFNITSPKLCFGATSYTIAQFKNDFAEYKDFDVNFSTDGSAFNPNEINPFANTSVFVKVSKEGLDCTAIGKLTFDFYPKVLALDPAILPAELQQCASGQSFDLTDLAQQYINNTGNVIFTFYHNINDAQTFKNPITSPYRPEVGSQDIFVRVQDKATGCYATNIPYFSILVYNKPQQKQNLKTNIKHCEGDKIFSLPVQISDYFDLDSSVNASVIKYYNGNNQEISKEDFASYNADAGLQPYVVVLFNSTCSTQIKFSLSFNPLPKSKVSGFPVCGDALSLAEFKAKVINQPDNYLFTDQNGNSLEDFKGLIFPFEVKFFITDKTTGCKSDLQTVTLTMGLPTAVKTTEIETEPKCDNDFDGIGVKFNHDDYKSEITDDASAVFSYFSDSDRRVPVNADFTTTSINQIIYGTVTSTNFCPTNFEINLIVKTPTKSSTLVDKYFVCYGEAITIDAGPENTDFAWSDGQTGQNVKFREPGRYSVTFTNSEGCSYTHNFEISDEHQPKITNVKTDNNQIAVSVSGGTAPYEYFFNGKRNDNGNILSNPDELQYAIQVRDSKGCLGPPKEIYFVKIPNVITPNGDGINDTWSVENLDKMDAVEVIVADRYGKTVFKSTDKNFSWNGLSAGKLLPSTSYWYVVKWYDPGTEKNEVRQGWILLKNSY